MRIAYCVPHPVTGAVGSRVRGVIKALAATGLADGIAVVAPSLDPALPTPPGIRFVATELWDGATRSRCRKLRRRLALGQSTTAALDAMDDPPELLIIYGGGATYMGRLQRWARRRGARVAADVVEWYDSSHLPLGRYGPFALDNRLMMTWLAPRCDGVIAISRFLETHFRAKGAQVVVRIPPITEVVASAKPQKRAPSDRVELAYCGDPGKKDRLDLIIQSVVKLDPEGKRLRLTVAGPSPEQVARLSGLDVLPPSVRALGRVSGADAAALVSAADWMPLLRDNKRFAQAGFPTKVAEALIVGTPVIANLTSDLSDVVVDGASGLVVPSADSDSMYAALVRALDISADDHAKMEHSAILMASEYFDYHDYVEPLRNWLKQIGAQ